MKIPSIIRNRFSTHLIKAGSTFALFILPLLLLTTSTVAQPPVINGLSPNQGPIGTVITITGSHFSATATNNVVSFGGVRATVSAASPSSLTVTLPRFASGISVTVTNLETGLTTYAAKPFVLTFPGGDNSFTTNSFTYPGIFTTAIYSVMVAVSDLDGDGKPDLAVSGTGGGSAGYLSILRNTTTGHSISFADTLDFPDVIGSMADGLQIADMNGDGKPDIIGGFDFNLAICLNTSTPGHISLAAPVYISSGIIYASKFEINDLDADGKPDIVLMDNGLISVLRNTGTTSTVSFDNIVSFQTGSTGAADLRSVRIADMDGDGKQDICFINFSSDNMTVLQNLCTPGSISFTNAMSLNFPDYTGPADMSITDLDGDGKQDVCIADYETDYVAFFRNTSTIGSFSFEQTSGFGQQYGSTIVRAFDLNGDGKPDIVNGRSNFNTSQISRNYSVPGSFLFDARVPYTGSDPGADIEMHDMNGDGKPEILMTGGGGQMRVFENTVSQTITGCTTSISTIPSYLIGTTYQWQQNSGSNFVNISNGPNLSGTNTANLQIVNPPISWNGYLYRCIVGTDTSNVIANTVADNIVPTISISNCPIAFCNGDTTVFTATNVNGGTNPQYQWQDSSTVAGWQNIVGATTATLKYATNTTGTKIRCNMTSSYSCANPAMLTSNTITIHFTCNTSTTLCANGNTQLTSNLTGSFYFWEADTGGGNIISLSNGVNYSGVSTATLTLTNIPSSFYGYRYFCYASGAGISNSFIVKFTNTWTGAVSSAWENPANWSCGTVPDSGTDVIINSGSVIIGSNAIIRSLTTGPGANVSVQSGFNLTILH